MRIIIICGAGYVSGKEKIMLSLLKGFAKSGDEVHCITSSWGNGQFESLLLSEKISYNKLRLGFISKTLDWSAFKMTAEQLFYLPALLYKYKKIVARFKPDVIVHSNFHHTFLLYPAIKKNKAVHIYHSHESIQNTKFYRKLFLLFQKKIKLFVGVSTYVTNKLAALGIEKNKLKTIHNGLEIIEWKVQPHTGNTFNIGIIGQVGAWKGHEDLVNAIEILRNATPGLALKLSIFGDGKTEFVKELKELIDQKKLNEFVEWKGFVNNITDIYAGLNVVCTPSRSEEPFATSALEAGLYGVPVIVTRRGGFPEIVTHAYNGYIVEAHSPNEIAKYLDILIKDPALAFQTGLNHQATINEYFSYARFITEWKTCLTQLNQ